MDDQNKLVKISKVVISYYEKHHFAPSENDFKLWIESLRNPIKEHFKAKGLNDCKGVLDFKRFYFELRDISLEDYLKINLSSEDYQLWKDKN